MRKSVLFGLIALFASLVPAFAGEVYVPFASNKTLGGTVYRTKVWVTNTGSAARRCDLRFLDQGTDGTKAGAPVSVTVSPGATTLLTNIAPDGKSGILEVSGAAQLVVTARLEALTVAGVLLSSANVPVASVANVFAANKVAELQGIERTARGSLTDFGVLNLNRTSTQCTVKAFRVNSAQIGQTAILSLPPLSVRHFDDALAILGQNVASDVRMEVSCDKQFFPYALVYKAGGPDTNFVVAAGTLDGDLVPGSGGGGGGGQDGAVVFQQAGNFLQARQGNSYISFSLPLVNGVQYKTATIEYDVYVDRFPPGLFAGVTSLRRNDRTLYYGLIIRGDKAKTILDLGVTDDVLQGENGGPWAERSNFHVSTVYDTVGRQMTFKVLRGSNVVQSLTTHINHMDLSTNGHVVSVDFGQSGIADGAYFPPIGWIFSNLKVTLVP